jgi:hypothetical protein
VVDDVLGVLLLQAVRIEGRWGWRAPQVSLPDYGERSWDEPVKQVQRFRQWSMAIEVSQQELSRRRQQSVPSWEGIRLIRLPIH